MMVVRNLVALAVVSCAGCASSPVVESDETRVGDIPKVIDRPVVDTAPAEDTAAAVSPPDIKDVEDVEGTICDLRLAEPTPLALGASKAEANTAMIIMDNTSAWKLMMPAKGDGWFTVEIPDWMTIARLSTDEGVELDVQGGDPFSALRLNPVCPKERITDQRMAFHEWGAYQVRIAEGAPAEVWFTLIKE